MILWGEPNGRTRPAPVIQRVSFGARFAVDFGYSAWVLFV